MAADASPPRPDDSTPALRFEDGLGPRLAAQDAFGEPIEHLRLCADLAALEPALRERIGRLINFRHARYVRLRGSERLPGPDKHIVIAYDAVQGVRLSQVLELAAHGALTLDIDTALLIVRELLPAIAVLHDSRSVTHGAIGPERLVLTTPGRLLIVDHGLGLALGKLAYSRRKFWQQLRVAVPPGTAKVVFDARTDVVQIGLVALALVLGRPIGRDEYPQDLPKLIDGAREQPAKGAARPLSPELRGWLERALPTSHKAPFLTVREAQQAFETLFTRTRPAAGAAALKTLSNACEAALSGTTPPAADVSDSSRGATSSASPATSASTTGSSSRKSLALTPGTVSTADTAADDAAAGPPLSGPSSPPASMLTPVPARPRRVPLVTPIADEEMPRVKNTRGEPRSGEAAASGTVGSSLSGVPSQDVTPLENTPLENTPIEKTLFEKRLAEKASVDKTSSEKPPSETQPAMTQAATTPAAIVPPVIAQAATEQTVTGQAGTGRAAPSSAFALDAMAALRALEAELSASEIDERESGCGTARELISPSHSELAGLSTFTRVPSAPNAGNTSSTPHPPDTSSALNVPGRDADAASFASTSPTTPEASDAAGSSRASATPGVFAAPAAPVAPAAHDDASASPATSALEPSAATVAGRTSSASPDSAPSSETLSSAVGQTTPPPMMELTAQELSAFEQAASDTYQDAASSLRARTHTDPPASTNTAAIPPAPAAKGRLLDAQAILMLTSVDDETSLDLALAPQDAGADGGRQPHARPSSGVDAPGTLLGGAAARDRASRPAVSAPALALPSGLGSGAESRSGSQWDSRSSAESGPVPTSTSSFSPSVAADTDGRVDATHSPAPQGAGPHGATPKGVALEGVASEDVAPSGAGSQGVSAQGVGPSAAAANDVSAIDVSSKDDSWRADADTVGSRGDADAAPSDERVDTSSASSRTPAPVAPRSRWLRFRRAAPVVDDVGRGESGEAGNVGEAGEGPRSASDIAAVSADAAGLASAPTSESASASESEFAVESVSVSTRVADESSPSPAGADDTARDPVSSAAEPIASAGETAAAPDDEKATPARGGWFRLRKPARGAKGERSRKEPESSVSEPMPLVTDTASVEAGRQTPLGDAIAQAPAITLAESSRAARRPEQVGSASEAASASASIDARVHSRVDPDIEPRAEKNTASDEPDAALPASHSPQPDAEIESSAPAPTATPTRSRWRLFRKAAPDVSETPATSTAFVFDPSEAASAQARREDSSEQESRDSESTEQAIFEPAAQRIEPTARVDPSEPVESIESPARIELVDRTEQVDRTDRRELLDRVESSERAESVERGAQVEQVEQVRQVEQLVQGEQAASVQPTEAMPAPQASEPVAAPVARSRWRPFRRSARPVAEPPVVAAPTLTEAPVLAEAGAAAAAAADAATTDASYVVGASPATFTVDASASAEPLVEPAPRATVEIAEAETGATRSVASLDASPVASPGASQEPQQASASTPVPASWEDHAQDAADEAVAELPATWRRGDRQAPSTSPEIGERSDAASATGLRVVAGSSSHRSNSSSNSTSNPNSSSSSSSNPGASPGPSSIFDSARTSTSISAPAIASASGPASAPASAPPAGASPEPVASQGTGLLADVAAATASPAARAPRPPRARLHINWKRTLAASLVVSLLEGVAFATAWWFAVPTEPGSLLVETSPPGVEVLVDGRVSGKTPYSASMPPGRHTIELRRGATSRVIPVEISAGVQTSQRVMWSKGLRTGQARITSAPDGARVMIDGQAHGITPLTVSTLAAGRHTVVITSDSGTVSAPLSISPGETTEMDVPVFPGWVSVLAPVELSIHEGERLLGTTEGEKLMLAPGRHVLQFTSEPLGYKTTQTVLVTPGATVAVSLVLPKVPVAVQGPAGAQLFIDGEPAGALPIDSVRAALGTRDFMIRHPQLGERRQAITVTQHAPARIVFD